MDLPAPPYPADTRAKGWRVQISMEALMFAPAWAMCPWELHPHLVMIQCVAWTQTPVGSVPDDDAIIAALIHLPLETFQRNKGVLLWGFALHSDGRLYHDGLVAQAMGLVGLRASARERKAAGKERVRKLLEERKARESSPNFSEVRKSSKSSPDVRRSSAPEPDPEPEPEPDPEPDPDKSKIKSNPLRGSSDRGVGKEVCNDAQERQRSRSRGSRLTLESLPDDWRAWCISAHPGTDPDATWEVFRDYWTARAGAEAVKVDWAATWRNWIRRDADRRTPAKVTAFPLREERVAAHNAALLRRVCGGDPTTIDGEYALETAHDR